MVMFITTRPIQRWNGSLIRDADPISYHSISEAQETKHLAVDVLETADSYVVRVSLPGASPDDVQVLVEDDLLNIAASMPAPPEKPGAGTWLMKQRPFGRFGRVLRLPKAVDADASTTELKDGVLTVTLSKKQSARARRLMINSDSRPAIEGKSRDITED